MVRRILMVLFAVAMIVIAGCGSNADDAISTDGAVAVVNGQPIAGEYFNKQYDIVERRYSAAGLEISELQFLEDAIIPQVILVQEAQRNGIKVTSEEVYDFVENETERIRLQLGDEQFNDELANIGMTLEELKADNRRAYGTQLYITRLLEEQVWTKVTVTDEEIEEFYNENIDSFVSEGDEVRASHILVDTEAEALEVLELLNDGEDFADLARMYSSCPSAPAGGDLNFFGSGMMIQEFEDAAFALDIGEVSGPVKTDFGWHVILVTDFREQGTLPLSDVEHYIREELQYMKQTEAEETYIDNLISNAEVRILLGAEDGSEVDEIANDTPIFDPMGADDAEPAPETEESGSAADRLLN